MGASPHRHRFAKVKEATHPLKPTEAPGKNLANFVPDLAKKVFQIFALNESVRATSKKQVKRDQLVELFFKLQPGLVGI